MLPLRLLLSLILIDRCWSLYEIDWNQCFAGSSRSCYVDGNCVPTVANSSRTLQQLTTFENLISRKSCNIGIQTRTYSDSKLLMILQVLDQGKAGDSSELALYQGEELLAGCKRTSEGFDILGQDKSRSLALYKDATHFNDNHMVCAFTIYRPAEFTKSAKQQLVTNLRFSVGSGSTLSTIPLFAKGKFVFQISQSVTCDPDDIIMQRSIEDHHVVPIKDINRDVLDCTNQDSSLGYTLMYTDVNATSTEIKSVSCVPLDESAVNLEYAWHILFKTNVTPVVIDDPQLFGFACATKITKMCGNPLKCSGDDCPVFSGGTESNDAKINCPGGKWVIDGDYYTDIQPQCKAEMTKMNTANFYINLGESEVDFTSGKCFKNYDCNLKSRLDYSNCDEKEEECALLKRDNTTITCDKNRKVIVQVRQKNKTMSASKFTCNTPTGQWRDEKEEAIPAFSLVMCEVVAKAEAEAEDNTWELVWTIAGGVIGVLVVSIVAKCGLDFCLDKKRTLLNLRMRRYIWKFLKPETRREVAKEVFETICTGDSSYISIIRSLDLLDLLLKSETEDPAIWELAQMFLTRLRGAVQNYDQTMYAQLGRYLFVRATKIIDKHGWISKNPVTNTNHKGYIITVAVQLLGNAMYSSTGNEHAEDLLVEGFRKLRYAGESAYPQCGVLWSLITQINIPISRKEGVIRRQNFKKMNLEFFKLVNDPKKCVMPEEDVIPQHGCVRQQAFTAIACSTHYHQGQVKFQEYFEHKEKEWFLEGLCRNVFYMDPAEFPLVKWKAKNEVGVHPALVRDKIVLGPEGFDKLIKKMMKWQSYNMKILDAHVLETLGAYPEYIGHSEYYRGLRLELSQFNACRDAEASAIKEWLQKAIKNNTKRGKRNKTSVQRPLVQLIDDDYSGLPGNDESGFVEDPLPIRQRECTASPEVQALCHKLLDTIFSKKSYCGVRLEYKSSDILTVLIEVQKIFETEPILIEDVPGDTYVVADIHGQFHDLFHYLTWVESPEATPGFKGGKRFVFTGDYVDRGHQNLEVVMTLFVLKILYPDKFFILRGNHEDMSIHMNMGFVEELLRRFGYDSALLLHKQFVLTFSYLSFAAIVGGKVFCAHAGPPARPVNKNFFHKTSKPIFDSAENTALHDLLWGDPAIGLNGTCFNVDRQTSIYYSESTVDFFLKTIGCTALARGHQVMTPGYAVLWNRLISLFSAATYELNKDPNGAAIMHVAADGVLQVLVAEKNAELNELRATAEEDVKDDDKKKDDDDEKTVDDGQRDVAVMKG